MKHFYQSVGGTKLVRRDFGDPNAYHVIAEGLKPKQCEDLQRLLSEEYTLGYISGEHAVKYAIAEKLGLR
jgi:hypothetical protein